MQQLDHFIICFCLILNIYYVSVNYPQIKIFELLFFNIGYFNNIFLYIFTIIYSSLSIKYYLELEKQINRIVKINNILMKYKKVIFKKIYYYLPISIFIGSNIIIYNYHWTIPVIIILNLILFQKIAN